MRNVLIQKILKAVVITLLMATPMAFAGDVKNSGVSAAENANEVTEQSLNINKASAKEIAKKLNGIGDSKANAIIEYREIHGNFKSVDDLLKVKGVGKVIVDKNREIIVL